MKTKGNKIIPETGKVLRRKSDGFIINGEITLGLTFYAKGVRLKKAKKEKPEDYEEIDRVLIDEERPVVAPPDEVIVEIPAETAETVQEEALPEQEEVAPAKEPVVITVQDIISLSEKVEKIYSLLTPEQKEELKHLFK
jgi:hypothetical protein